MGGEFTPQPTGLDAILARLRKLEREVESLRGAAVVKNSSIGGGRLTVFDAGGHPIGILGSLDSGETGFFVFRPDGSLSFNAWTSEGGFTALFDHAGNYIVTEDTTSGQGIARPYVPMGAWCDTTAPTATTASTSWSTLQVVATYKQHPAVLVQLLVRTGASPGQVRIVDDNGAQIGSVKDVDANSFYYTILVAAIPGPHMRALNLNLQARITNGSAPIGVRGISAIGVESQLLEP